MFMVKCSSHREHKSSSRADNESESTLKKKKESADWERNRLSNRQQVCFA